MRFFFLAASLAAVARADMYLQNPRGSNNRLDDQNRDRNNGNRLFDSQNNNRGGSNVGQMYYYKGSEINFEWSAQHSCGGPNNNCEVVVQYMCDNRLRDGTTTNTIPVNPADCYDWDCDTDVRYGRHESFDFYKSCMYRSRNMGLFTSSENLKGNGAIYTRQNPNGDRRGYECPEERDYYPYWHPTPWKDAAILTNQPQRCAAYQQESQNIKDKFYCDVPHAYIKKMNYKKGIIPITQSECEAINEEIDGEIVSGVWRFEPNWGIAAPECLQNTWSRDNHHGNVEGGTFTGFNWTVPDFIHEQCVVRVRYNISTGDISHFDGLETVESAELNAENNPKKKGKNEPAQVAIAADYAIADEEEAMKREYYLKNNPQVDMWGTLLTPKTDGSARIQLQMAIDTSQYGRTFQDRTHKFAIRDPPVQGRIHNLNVRGKRGNVVQTYPGTEYDFVPNRLHCRKGDYVHFQWTGSNTNPNNNAGQGRQGSDRHNVVPLRVANYKEMGLPGDDEEFPTMGHWGNSYPARIDQVPFLGLSREDMQHLAILDTPGGQFGGELSELDDAGTYFDLGLKQCSIEGIYHYLCTRNNNFSNRSQKGKIVVDDRTLVSKSVGYAGAMVVDSSTGNAVTVEQDSLVNLQQVSIQMTPSLKAITSICDDQCELASDYVSVQPAVFQVKKDKTVKVSVAYDVDALGWATMYHSPSGIDGTFEELDDVECSDGVCHAQVTKGGTFAVQTNTAWGAIIPSVLLIGGMLGGGGYLIKKKMAQRAFVANKGGI
jgi:hypothetical protein